MSGMPKVNASMLADNVGKLVCLVGKIAQVSINSVSTHYEHFVISIKTYCDTDINLKAYDHKAYFKNTLSGMTYPDHCTLYKKKVAEMSNVPNILFLTELQY